MAENNTVLVLLNDLMFRVKIDEAAKRAGITAVFTDSREGLLREAIKRPTSIILDLNFAAANPLTLISDLKASEGTREIRLIGYVSHVQVDVRVAATEAGCDTVMARSAFVQNLPRLLASLEREELSS